MSEGIRKIISLFLFLCFFRAVWIFLGLEIAWKLIAERIYIFYMMDLNALPTVPFCTNSVIEYIDDGLQLC
jgi:hypothetical protein